MEILKNEINRAGAFIFGGNLLSPCKPTSPGLFYRYEMSGGIIYKVTNLINGKIYIGKTKHSLEYRKKGHLHRANNKKFNLLFNNAIKKYGINNFKWEIIDQCLFYDSLSELEKYYIKKLQSKIPHGYNMTDGGEGIIGYKPTEEVRRNASEAQSGIKNHNYGKPMSEEQKKKISDANKGKIHTRETIEKIIKSKTGKYLGINNPLYGRSPSLEATEKNRLAHMGEKNARFGKHITEEHKEKIRIALRGNKYMLGKHHSDATKKKIGEVHKGNQYALGKTHTVSGETRKKMSELKIGKPWTQARRDAQNNRSLV